MIRVICIGNRFAYPDNFGILIYEKLKKLNLDDVEIVEGGVGGDSLALYFEDSSKILIVDYACADMPKIATHKDISTFKINEYNHANSLIYFLKMIQKEYTLYLCNDNFDENSIDTYMKEILQLIEKLQCT